MTTAKEEQGKTSVEAGEDLNALLNATLISRHDINPGLSIVKVKPDEGEVPEFEPGQFATLGMPPEAQEFASEKKIRLIRRAYSIASPPDWRDHMEFYVVLVAEGKLTPKLWTVREGGRLWLSPKIAGHMTMTDIPKGKDLVMLATGTGLAPFLSMLKAYRARGEGAGKRWRKFVIVHGVRVEEDLGYKDELEQIQAEDDSVVYLPTVSRPEGALSEGVIMGRVQAALEKELYEAKVGRPLSPDNTEVFLCGNPAMIDQMQQDLEAKGFVTHTKKQPGNIHFERYW